LDLTTQEKEFENLMYPVSLVDEYETWFPSFFEYWEYDKERIKFWNEFHKKIILGFNNYSLPVIQMTKENPKEAVCQVFEKVNTGGVSLSVFELLTATFASEEFDLKEDWANIKSQFKPYKVLDKTSEIDFIQAVTLVSTYRKKVDQDSLGLKDNIPAVSAKRKRMLNLELTDI
jgi:hypothetical protein